MKKFYIETYGCQMNFAQSLQLNEKMKTSGYQAAVNSQEADIIIINACSVRQHAEKRVFNRILFYNTVKKKRRLQLVVTGCFAQNNKEKIEADYIFGTYKMDQIPELITDPDIHLNVDMDEYAFLSPVRENTVPFRSLVDITKGCDNYCSYCIVPYVRGPQFSRKSKELLEEIKNLAGQGVKEIILLGQNVNSYGLDNHDIHFGELLFKINNISGIERIRFVTSHPKDFSDEIIEAVFQNTKVCPAIHLPLQSGSDRILNLMNRKYTMEQYHRIVEKMRSYQRDFSLSTDLLVGFPGETEKDLMLTVEAVQKIRFNESFTFKYSSRPYIKANEFAGQVSEKEKSERLDQIIKVQRKIEKEKVKEHLSKKRTVLAEKKSRKDKNKIMGRDELNYVVILDKNAVPGNFYQVLVKDIRGITLIGEIIP